MNVDLSTVVPWLPQIAFGAVAGFVAGYALKKLGKVVALTLGVLFVIIQLLAWGGFLTVNWGAVQDTMDPLLETSSLERAWHGLLTLLTYNVPFAATFVPALVIGVKRG